MSAGGKKQYKRRSSVSKTSKHIPQPRSAYSYFFRFCKIIDLLPDEQTHFSAVNETNRGLYKCFVERILSLNPDDFREKNTTRKYIGMGNFDDMSKDISMKWAEADESSIKSVFREIAKKDSDRYKKELFDSYQSFTKNFNVNLGSDGTARTPSQIHTASASNPSIKKCSSSHVATANVKQDRDYSRAYHFLADIATVSLQNHDQVGYHGGKANLNTNRALSTTTVGTNDPNSSSMTYQVKEADTPNNEIISMAISEWGLCSKVFQFTQKPIRGKVGLSAASPTKANINDLHTLCSGVDWN